MTELRRCLARTVYPWDTCTLAGVSYSTETLPLQLCSKLLKGTAVCSAIRLPVRRNMLKGDSIHISLPARKSTCVVSAIFNETTQSTAHPRLCVRVRVCVSVFRLNLRVHLPKTKCEILRQSQGETTWAIPMRPCYTPAQIVALMQSKECGHIYLCMY